MSLAIDSRQSDSPLVKEVWRTVSETSGSFISVAATHWEMVVTTRGRHSFLTVRGPETKATPLAFEAGAEWVGIRFNVGAFLTHLPARLLVDSALNLPDAGSQSFWLLGSAWEF